MRSRSDRLRPLVECGLTQDIAYLEDNAGGHDDMARHADCTGWTDVQTPADRVRRACSGNGGLKSFLVEGASG